MRITCTRCDQVAVIRTSREMSQAVKQLYCVCQNPECGHTFVMDLTFSHTLSPSAFDLPEAVRAGIQQKSPVEIISLFDGLG